MVRSPIWIENTKLEMIKEINDHKKPLREIFSARAFRYEISTMILPEGGLSHAADGP